MLLTESWHHICQLCISNWGRQSATHRHPLPFLLDVIINFSKEGAWLKWAHGEARDNATGIRKRWRTCHIRKGPGLAERPKMPSHKQGRQRNPFTAAVKEPPSHRGKGAWLFQVTNLLPPPTWNPLRKWKWNAGRGLILPSQPHAYEFFFLALCCHTKIHTRKSRLANWLLKWHFAWLV